jgi:hypothetical protein
LRGRDQEGRDVVLNGCLRPPAPVEEVAMPAVVWVVGGLVVFVAVLLTIDWFTAGRVKGRILVSARDQNATDASVGYTQLENDAHGVQYQQRAP